LNFTGRTFGSSEQAKNRRKNRVFGGGTINDRAAMKTKFRIVGLSAAQFEPLFSLDDVELAQKGARRLKVDAKPGFPCRVSLADAEIGEQIILLPFAHHDVESPYRASGPIFVGESAKEADLEPGTIPDVVRGRVLSVRAYEKAGMMIDATVTRGAEMESRIEALFANPNVNYLHLHNAGAGCYSCQVERVR
jgi:uncharacterized protein DUF1203